MSGLGSGKCKVCGCTEDDACITEDGACSWSNEKKDCCTACVPAIEFYPEVHLYQCSSCIATVGVDAGIEDQSSVCCPICHTDEWLEDAGFGYVTITRTPKHEVQEDILGETEQNK